MQRVDRKPDTDRETLAVVGGDLGHEPQLRWRGGSMTDLVTFGESMLRFSPPDYERLETVDQLDVRVAGAESNVAVAASRLGLDARWVSKLPDSPLGRRVVNELRGAGLETEITWSSEGRQGTYYIEFGTAPRGTDVIYDRDRSAVTSTTPEELPTHLIEEAAAFYVSGITPALSATLEATTGDLLEIAQAAGTEVVFDLNYRSKLWTPSEARAGIEALLPDIDLLVVADRDATEVLEVTGSADAVLAKLAGTWDLDGVILTQGAEGAEGWFAGDRYSSAALETETIDPIGTGDAFVGGFLASWLEHRDPERAMEYGAATAALKRTIPGDIAILTPDEVEGVLTSAESGIDR